MLTGVDGDAALHAAGEQAHDRHHHPPLRLLRNATVSDGMSRAAPVTMQTLDGVHVLLVEDHTDSRELMKLVMEYQGALVIPVPDAKAALAALATLRPDVLVTDISMPEQDGVELVREARERGLLDGVPTIAVSAFPQERTYDASFDAYLRKPIDPNELCGTVQALVRRRKPPISQG